MVYDDGNMQVLARIQHGFNGSMNRNEDDLSDEDDEDHDVNAILNTNDIHDNFEEFSNNSEDNNDEDIEDSVNILNAYRIIIYMIVNFCVVGLICF